MSVYGVVILNIRVFLFFFYILYFLKNFQANEYCEQVKNSAEGWQLCVQLFMKEPKA